MGSQSASVEAQGRKIRDVMRLAKDGRRVSAQQLGVPLNSVDNAVLTLIKVVAMANGRTFNPPRVDIQLVLGSHITDVEKVVGNTMRGYKALARHVHELERILERGAQRNNTAADRPMREAYKLTVALRHYVTSMVEVFKTAGLPQSEIRKDQAELVHVDAPLYRTRAGERRDIQPEDIRQGVIGNCYFMATAAAVAQTCPQQIRDMIRDNKDGTYTVTFPVQGGAKKVTVDNRFHRRAADKWFPYAKPSPDSTDLDYELWPLILEKAYAKLQGSYEGNVTGSENGVPSSALKLFGYGNNWEQNWFSTKSEAQYKRILQEAVREKRPVVFANWGHCLALKEIRNGNPVLYDPHGNERPFTWAALCQEMWSMWVGQPAS